MTGTAIEINKTEIEGIFPTNPFGSKKNEPKIFVSSGSTKQNVTYTFDEKLEESISSETTISQYSFAELSLKNFIFHKSPLSSRIIRTHYTQEILSTLLWLSQNHKIGSLNSIIYINQLFKSIKDCFDKNFQDPFVSYLLAIYDGLSYNNKWVTLPPNAFEKIHKITQELNNQELDYKKVDKYIIKLEEIGINVLPYQA